MSAPVAGWVSAARRRRSLKAGAFGLAFVSVAWLLRGEPGAERAAFFAATGLALVCRAGAGAWADLRARRRARRGDSLVPDPLWASPGRQRAVSRAWTGAGVSWGLAMGAWSPEGSALFLVASLLALGLVLGAWRAARRDAHERRVRDQAEVDAAARGWLTPRGFADARADLDARASRAQAAQTRAEDDRTQTLALRMRLEEAGVSDGRTARLAAREQRLAEHVEQARAWHEAALHACRRLCAEEDAAALAGEHPDLLPWLLEARRDLDRREQGARAEPADETSAGPA